MADKYPEIYVLRHGQTEWNLAGRFQGRMDSKLTAKGRAQAGVQATLLSGAIKGRGKITAYSSPQGRAAKTAAIALAPLGLQAREDARLCEISFGKWEGLGFKEIAKGWPGLVNDSDQDGFDWQFHAPGGETLHAMQARVQAFLSSLSAPGIIITHGITSRLLRMAWLGSEGGDIGEVMGGQGCVYHLRDGQQIKLEG